jgi:RNA polymerase sigma factor (sigma-70 family)
MRERWDLAFERMRAAADRTTRGEAERAFFAVARELGRKMLRRFREIPDDEREELVQDAFVRLLDHRPAAEGSMPWFVTVVRRLALDVVRSKGHAQRRDAARDDAEGDGVPLDHRPDRDSIASEDAVAARMDARTLLGRLSPRLSPRDRAWLEQVLLGSTHQEIADTHGVSKATVDKAMQRTWEKVRSLVPVEARG